MVAENFETEAAASLPSYEEDVVSASVKDEPVWIEAAISAGGTIQRLPSGDYIIIPDQYRLTSKRNTLINGGISSLQIISDFDFTLTSSHVNGKKGSTSHGCLETCGLLTEEYHRTVQGLKAKYYPLELDATLQPEQRVSFMLEWVVQAHEALSTAGLTKQIIRDAVSLANIGLRTGHDALFNHIAARSIPFLIFSAGLADVLEEVLHQHAQAPLPSFGHIISNRMIFEDDEFVGFKGPLFHVFNKKASTVISEPYFSTDEIKSRPHVLILGDSLGDLSMASGLETKEVLSIGYLNENVSEFLEDYMKGYDVIIIGQDAGMHYPLQLLSEIP